MKITANNLYQFETETGAALVTSILGLLLITALGFAILSVGENARAITTNDRENTEAFFVAEAGMTHALQLIDTQGQANYSKILANNAGTAEPCDQLANGDLITNYADPIPDNGASLPEIPGNNYRVCVENDADDPNPLLDENGRIIVRVVGTGRNNATATLEGSFGSLPFPGVLLDGQTWLNGTLDVIGAGGSIHSNGTMRISGRPCVEQYFSSASAITVTASGHPETGVGAGCTEDGSDVRPSQPRIEVPDYDVANWRDNPNIPVPDFIFTKEGVVFKKNGLVSGTNVSNSLEPYTGPVPAGGYTYYGRACQNLPCVGNNKQFKETIAGVEVTWSFNDVGVWSILENPHGGRTYHFQNSNLYAKNLGTQGSYAIVTLMADGWIEIAGNSFVTPMAPDVQMMAGTDLALTGNLTGSTTNFHGLHYARHQIEFAGNPIISGQVIAKNLFDTPFNTTNKVARDGSEMKISGTVQITYDGTGVVQAARLLNWREVRN